jgi:hypothetical protein
MKLPGLLLLLLATPVIAQDLKRDKILVTKRTAPQVFSVYQDPEKPIFVTSDSVLAAYHRVFEESFRRFEHAQAVRMKEAVRELRDALPKDASMARYREILEESLWLFENDVEGEDPETMPRGFYAGDPILRRYFRALSCLQTEPVPVETEAQRESWRQLKKATENLHDVYSTLRSYDAFVGEIRTPCLLLPLLPENAKSVTILAPAISPDGRLFHATTWPDRPMPDPLDLCGVLGGDWAQGKMDWEVVKRAVTCWPAFEGDSIPARYFRVLKALLDDAEPEAPELFSERPWQIKSCQTALAGWAQLRHTFALHVWRSNPGPGEAPEPPPGFVEPDPEFFGRLERLVRHTRRILQEHGAFDRRQDRLRLGYLAMAFAKTLEEGKRKLDIDPDSGHALWRLTRHVAGKSPARMTPAELRAAAGKLEATAKILIDLDRALERKLESVLGGIIRDVDRNWAALEALCSELRSLAHTQRRGRPFDERETEWLKGYGDRLAGIMFTGVGATRDDAPRITDVHHHPASGRRLHVGIARPREFLILYPWKGKEVLCVGAVLPYYEVVTKDVLTDAGWKAMLDSEKPPEPPEWTRRITRKE